MCKYARKYSLFSLSVMGFTLTLIELVFLIWNKSIKLKDSKDSKDSSCTYEFLFNHLLSGGAND